MWESVINKHTVESYRCRRAHSRVDDSTETFINASICYGFDMGQRRFHYEHAFEALLRRRRLPYVCVDEARKALLPERAIPRLSNRLPDGRMSSETDSVGATKSRHSLKSFDFVVYDGDRSLLVDVKGRKVTHRQRYRHGTKPGSSDQARSDNSLVAATRRSTQDPYVSTSRTNPSSRGTIRQESLERRTSGRPGRMESWVTEDDVHSLGQWKSLFGQGYEALFVFLYWCEAQPPDALYQEVFEHRGRWYAVRAVELEAYRARMTRRSIRWRTVHLQAADFESVSQPFREMLVGMGSASHQA